ncbi:DUF1330 domain-containing protein [Stutzerimonas azotifigens]|uniref:DUF1330 domain-containing protein n=1 Tax=Stutzerimonas azotifigens TaxID=291995 RepID=A0ABR5Z418_9GAMM|nr:DUF1330 domain-containing protein [Stutzerimonas azotifigens]MBA1274973.1 DUF1330 domain-containing protein [Stutzerimonas azotifigens]
MPSLNPSREQLEQFARTMPSAVPILMLNLLRYNEQAAYPPGSSHRPCSGREAYARYSRVALQHLRAVGAEVEIMAQAHAALIAPPGEDWDELLLVRYPSKDAFLSMIANDDYLAASEHRTAALADSRLIGTSRR